MYRKLAPLVLLVFSQASEAEEATKASEIENLIRFSCYKSAIGIIQPSLIVLEQLPVLTHSEGKAAYLSGKELLGVRKWETDFRLRIFDDAEPRWQTFEQFNAVPFEKFDGLQKRNADHEFEIATKKIRTYFIFEGEGDFGQIEFRVRIDDMEYGGLAWDTDAHENSVLGGQYFCRIDTVPNPQFTSHN